MREVLREIMVKDWVSMKLESTHFTQCDKVLIKKDVDFYCECWNNRCVVLHYPNFRKKNLRKDTKEIKLETMSGTIEITIVLSILIQSMMIRRHSKAWSGRLIKREFFEQSLEKVGSKTQGIWCHWVNKVKHLVKRMKFLMCARKRVR